jgi:hypothetical protein
LKYSSWSLSTSCLALVMALAVACKPAVEDRKASGVEPVDQARYALNTNKADKLAVYTKELNVAPVADKMLLVIPTQGCVPCIDEALKFTAATEETSRLTILLSGNNKRLKALMSHKYKIDPGKMSFDSDNRAEKYGLITIYPALFWTDERGDVSVVDLHAGDIYKALPRVGLKVVGL